jgi:hypothetical protein
MTEWYEKQLKKRIKEWHRGKSGIKAPGQGESRDFEFWGRKVEPALSYSDYSGTLSPTQLLSGSEMCLSTS